MAVVLNKKNNVKLKIEAPMTSVSNLLIVDKWELLWDDFTSAETEKHFKWTLFKFDWENVSQIEICKVITKSGNFLTIERAVEPCPMNYSSNQMYQQAYDFEAGDWFYINLTAGDLEDIVTELKATNRRIDNVENNYVSKQQLNQEKWTTIATLGNDWKIPSNQIDTANLDVGSINYEFTAWESISAGDAVAVYGWDRTDNTSFKSVSASTTNETYVKQTVSLWSNDNYITKLTITINSNYLSTWVWIRVHRQENEIFAWIVYCNGTSTAERTFDVVINKPAIQWTRNLEVKSDSSWRRVDATVIFVTQKYSNTALKVCKCSSSIKNKQFIWYAVNSWASWSTIKVQVNWVVNKTWILPWVKYWMSKGVLYPWMWAWIWLSTNRLLINRTTNMQVIYTRVKLLQDSEAIFNHSLWTVPVYILLVRLWDTIKCEVITPVSVDENQFTYKYSGSSWSVWLQFILIW